MKKYLALSILILIAVGVASRPLWAQETAVITTMQAANQLYEAGQYAEAANAYEHLVNQGVADSTLFYNLGNAYFKQGDIGRAILNYERAARLNPRDADIQANRDLARLQVLDQFEQARTGLLARVGEALRQHLTLDEVAGVTLFVWLLLGALLFAWRGSNGRWREPLSYLVGVTAVFVVLASFSLGSRLYIDIARPQAVIVADEINVTSGPGDQYVTEFTLHGGAEVELMETRGNWTRLQLPGGQLQGWVPAETVASVVSG